MAVPEGEDDALSRSAACTLGSRWRWRIESATCEERPVSDVGGAEVGGRLGGEREGGCLGGDRDDPPATALPKSSRWR